MKLTNTHKHLIGGLLAGYLGLIAILLPTMAVFIAIGIGMALLAFENAQRLRAKKKYINEMLGEISMDSPILEDKELMRMFRKDCTKIFNKQYRWLDTIVDFAAGYAAFNIVFWLIILVSR